MEAIAVLEIDLGKNICILVGSTRRANCFLHRRMKRDGLLAFAERLAARVVAMEAC